MGERNTILYIPNERCVLFRVTEERHEEDSFNSGRLDGEKRKNSKNVFGISKKNFLILNNGISKKIFFLILNFF
jgi:hypothetical protein